MANGFSYALREGGVVTVPATSDISDTLLVIGSALEGPDGVPVPIDTVDQAVLTFGPLVFDDRYPPVAGAAAGDYSGNNLVRDIEAAFRAGCNRVLAVRVGGEYATASMVYHHSSDVPSQDSGFDGQSVVRVRGLFKGAQYNGASITLAPGAGNTITVTVNQSAARGGSFTISGLPNTITIGSLISLVNNDARNLSLVLEPLSVTVGTTTYPASRVLELQASGLMELSGSDRVSTTFTLANGKYGVKQEYAGDASYKKIYEWLTDPNTGVFANIDGVAAEYVLLSALYADDAVAESGGAIDPSVSIVGPFAEFVAKLSELYPCHGIIGLQPLFANTPQELRALVNSSYLVTGITSPNDAIGVADQSSKRIKFGYFLTWGMERDDRGVGVDMGRYISVVAGLPAILGNSRMRRYTDTPAASYAGLLTILAPSEIPAFRAPAGLVGMAGPRLPRDLIDVLTTGIPYAEGYGGALVVIERNVALNNDLMVISDVTAASRNSVFSWLSNVRIANIASRSIQLALRPFLGKPNTADTLAAMGSVVRAILERLAASGALLGTEGIGYRYTLEPAGTGLQMTQVRVRIDMRPSAFIRAISVEVLVRP